MGLKEQVNDTQGHVAGGFRPLTGNGFERLQVTAGSRLRCNVSVPLRGMGLKVAFLTLEMTSLSSVSVPLRGMGLKADRT